MHRLAAMMLATVSCLAAATQAADPRIALVGSLDLPEAVTAPDGTAIPLVGLSGITWLGDDAWAAAMDNSDKMVTLSIELDDDGQPAGTKRVAVVKASARHDYEDIAPCPPALQQRIARRLEKRGEAAPGTCVLVCEEDTPAVRGLSLSDGRLLGAVPLPEIAKTCRPNRGLEALAVDPDGLRVWTANEEALAADGSAARRGIGTLVRLMEITLPTDAAAGDAAARADRQFAYRVDPPHEMVTVLDGELLSGVVALVALGEGRLLVLERSAGKGLPPFENRIYLVDTAAANDATLPATPAEKRPEGVVAKQLLWKDSLGCNMEGLAVGPRLADGGRALVGIADNGHSGGPSKLIFFTLK